MRIVLACLFALAAASADSSDKDAGRGSGLKTVTGIAQNGKVFAEVQTKAGRVPVSGLDHWPQDVEGQQVEVAGRFETFPAAPADSNIPTQGYARDAELFAMESYKIIGKAASANQAARRDVTPLDIQGVVYSLETSKARHWLFWHRWRCEVVATRGGKELWRKSAYSVALDESQERDVQEVYPKSLSADMSKIPDANGVYRIKGLSVVDENDRYHYLAVDQ